jgi:type I restriction enzyme M protein
MARKAKYNRTKQGNTGTNLEFEDKLWAAADKLRGNVDAAEYKHVVLGLLMEGKSYDDITPLFPEV